MGDGRDCHVALHRCVGGAGARMSKVEEIQKNRDRTDPQCYAVENSS